MCASLVGTLLNMPEKTKDGPKARYAFLFSTDTLAMARGGELIVFVECSMEELDVANLMTRLEDSTCLASMISTIVLKWLRRRMMLFKWRRRKSMIPWIYKEEKRSRTQNYFQE